MMARDEATACTGTPVTTLFMIYAYDDHQG